MSGDAATRAILDGRTALGVEFGSTRIKVCLVDADVRATWLAVGAHEWENQYREKLWTYAIDDVWSGLRRTRPGVLRG